MGAWTVSRPPCAGRRLLTAGSLASPGGTLAAVAFERKPCPSYYRTCRDQILPLSSAPPESASAGGMGPHSGSWGSVWGAQASAAVSTHGALDMH